MKVKLARAAETDLETGYWFYSAQAPGVGDYFLASLRADLSSLGIYGGIHRALSKRFPYAIYYVLDGDTVTVLATLDCRRDPEAIRDVLLRRPRPV